MSFSIAEIDFRDNVSFSFNLILDPARQLPMGMDYVETVLPVDMTTRGAQRPDRADTGVMYTQLLVYEFGFSTESPNVIGMESGVIQNCQITASSYLDTNRPEEARLNTGSGWKPLVRGAPFCTDEYLQINIGTSAYITGLQLQSTTNSYQDIVASFKLQFSDDGVIWYDVMTHTGISQMVFEVSVSGAGSVSDVYDVDLNETERFNAQYVRVISGPCLLGLRLELKGLKYTGPTVDCSTISETVTPVTEQSYVVDSAKGNIFVCGLESVGGDVYCSFSDDNGASWLEIDDNLSNIIALVSNTSIVIGKANDNVTLLVSEDDGFTWNALTDECFNELQAMAGYTEFKTFPYEDTRGQSFNDMYATYGMDGPGSMSLTGTISGIAVTDGGTWIETAWWGTDDWNLL
ncbi:lactadherin-like [Mercenaria mercenaria]|uniref:lactadherin-like n=1 Tax=Mercenaria mercenaria TaxID=6596 RepID=UPI00234F09F7|nr:lactadherin-like [Mercenaria mercenaria]